MIKWKYTKDEYPKNDEHRTAKINDPYYPVTVVYMDDNNEYCVGWFNRGFVTIDDSIAYSVPDVVKWAYLE